MMRKFIDFLFIRNYKMLIVLALVLFAFLVVFFVFTTSFLIANINDSLSNKNIQQPQVVYFDFDSLNKIKSRLSIKH